MKKFLKKLTTLEKAYTILFLLSILAGIAYGLIDRNYFKCCEGLIGVPSGGTTILKIFSNNLMISIFEMITAGLASLYFNFHTFSITSSYLVSQGGLITLPIVLGIGIFELVGGVLLALVGIYFVESFLKIKSKLDYKLLFLFGIALVFIGAVVEYSLLRLAT